MIYFDVTQARDAKHRSGLVRVSTRLREKLGARARAARWDEAAAAAQPSDWFLTAELFSEEERPGFSAFLEKRPCRLAAIYHDSIPLKFPETTWPKSVARHPHYLSLLAQFDRVWAVSAASREELLGFWAWQGLKKVPSVEVIGLGADFGGQPRVRRRPAAERRSLLCVGILEPRKNQALLLEICPKLWDAGLAFDLDLVGRVNPHFGEPIAARIRELARRYPGLHYHAQADDAAVLALYAQAKVSMMPTLAEGCGLPVLESLWLGVPAVTSDIAPILENAQPGGCLSLPANDRTAWTHALREVISAPALVDGLETTLAARALPGWSETAAVLAAALT